MGTGGTITLLIIDYKSRCSENQKHQTRVSFLLELVSDACLTANRTEDV